MPYGEVRIASLVHCYIRLWLGQRYATASHPVRISSDRHAYLGVPPGATLGHLVPRVTIL